MATSTSILDPVRHERLIANFEKFCTTANIQSRFLLKGVKDFCEPNEIQWVKNYWVHKKAGMPGMVLNGVALPDIKCQAICGSLLRNYIDARVISLNVLMESYKDGDPLNPSCLIVPNMYIKPVGKTNMPSWRVQALHDILLSRSFRGRPSVLYVEDFKAMSKECGSAFSEFLKTFKIVPELD